MVKTILQTVVFRNTNVEILYNLYLDAKLHSLVTGGTAKIQRKEGIKFSAYDGYCYGKNLQLIPNQLIIQSWRAADWDEDEATSTFILLLEQSSDDAIVHMTHANVPAHQYKALKDGWNSFYWKPWKEYLMQKK
jgi:activator of HSP90 ATPase